MVSNLFIGVKPDHSNTQSFCSIHHQNQLIALIERPPSLAGLPRQAKRGSFFSIDEYAP
jgi:hypothetical protein